jgi:hypothetical protein
MLLPGKYKGTRRHRWAQPRTLEQIIGDIFKVDWRLLNFGSTREKESHMPRSDYFKGGNFLKAAAIKHGQFAIVEGFEEAKTRLGTRPILRLRGFEEPFGLNATNYDKMVERFGEEEKKWAGKKIKLLITQAPNPSQGGKMQPAIRIE